MRQNLLNQKRSLENQVDLFLLLIDLEKAKLKLNKELALTLRSQIDITISEISKKYQILFDRVKELETWSRISALKTLENAILENKLAEIKAKYEEEMDISKLEELSKLGKML